MQLLRTRGARLVAVGAAALAVYACDSDRLVVPDYNNPSSGPIASDPGRALQLLGTGILRTDRDGHAGFVLGVGILGREAYNYTGNDGRNTTGYLTVAVNQPTSFAGVSLWAGFYQNLRQIKTFRGVVENAPASVLTDAQKAAGRGFAMTMEALTLHYLIATRHNIGIPTEVLDDAAALAPFVARDEVYARIKARLDSGAAELATAGTTAIPFTMHAGFAGFTTGTTFRQFNRAIAARINAYRGSLGAGPCAGAGRTACYAEVLTNLSESFLNPTGSLTAGPTRVYSTSSGDVQNGIRTAVAAILAHARTDSGVQNKPDGTRDNRFLAKVTAPTNGSAQPPGIGIPTTNDFTLYPSGSSPIAIIRNEELLLLRAEARYFTGDEPGARADINTVRTTSGGLAAIATPFATEAAFVDELLYNRRFSLLFEGHRWIDMRRFGRLAQLTRDFPEHVVVEQLPITQNECLARRSASGDQAVPALGNCSGA